MSTSRRRIQALLLALPAAALVWACQDVERPAPSALVAGRHIAYDEAPTPTLTNGVIYLCKSTPPGTSGTFEINMIVPLADGSQDNLQAHISSGECKPVTSTSVPNPTFITTENLSANPGWTLESVTLITTAGGTQELVGGAGLDGNPVTCTVDSSNGCILIFHNVPAMALGRMTGGGSSISIGDVKITKGLTLHCDITLSNNLEINWGANNWHLDKPIDSARCIDDPTVNPVPPEAPFDTFIGTATGKLNGVDGAHCEFTFVDAGEPGGKNDRAGIKIWDAGGNLVLDLPLSPTNGGNLQAHYDQPHGSNVNK